MHRRLVRLAMVWVGLASLAFYLAAATLVYLALRLAWAGRPSALTTVLLLVGVTLVGGYLSYRLGVERLLASIDAVELPVERAPRFFDRLTALSDRMGVERPRVLVGRLGEPNAFAVGGPSGGVVVVDPSLFALLTGDELAGVLAHELGHLQNRDGLLQTVAYTATLTVVELVVLALLPALLVVVGIAKADAWIRGRPTAWTRTFAGRFGTRVGGLVLVVPALFTLALLARSRRREYAADVRAARVTDDPLALARALRKIDRASERRLRLRSLVTPQHDRNDPLLRLLATHPAIDDRVERLHSFAAGGEFETDRR